MSSDVGSFFHISASDDVICLVKYTSFCSYFCPDGTFRPYYAPIILYMHIIYHTEDVKPKLGRSLGSEVSLELSHG